MTLKQLRQRNNLTQEQLAEMVGVTPSQISYIETGSRTPSLKVAMKISKIFKLPIEQIFLYESKQHSA